jgi:pteridine reductase
MTVESSLHGKVALVTGGARRIGAVTVRHLHVAGMNVVLHYHRSRQAAESLRDELEAIRPESICLVQGDLLNTAVLPTLVDGAINAWGRLDALVNNASSFHPTPIGSVTETDWDDLVGTNLRAPFFLCQAAAPYLAARQGAIVNITDIYAQHPLKSYPVYSIAKAGLGMLTKSLARELGPAVRVNAVAPGAILWPEGQADEAAQKRIIARTALKRMGHPDDIAGTVLFLIRGPAYITGQVIAVDGGRSV